MVVRGCWCLIRFLEAEALFGGSHLCCHGARDGVNWDCFFLDRNMVPDPGTGLGVKMSLDNRYYILLAMTIQSL